jgi:hypothetical protein
MLRNACGRSADGGWVELLDEGTGQPYYYHTGTLKTQWERPEGFEGVSCVWVGGWVGALRYNGVPPVP